MGARAESVDPTCPPEHSHSSWCYNSHGCRCDSCRAANSAAVCKASRKRSIAGRKPGLRLPITGTQRRLRALSVIGWNMTQVAERSGLSKGNLAEIRSGKGKWNDGQRVEVSARTYAIVKRTYEQMQFEPAPGKKGQAMARRARARGWHGPLDWKDIDRDKEPTLDEEDL